jgi:hypothetical protein
MPGEFAQDTDVFLNTDPKSIAMFTESAAVFRRGSRLPYEVQVISERPPVTEMVRGDVRFPLTRSRSLP